ncbi:MAG TPA: hypothetical protein VI336_03820, partial [Candidatus Saccharimonadales bacterium]|nr:hypothetical protein [Candidatus Saccharimonadales bacterium]
NRPPTISINNLPAHVFENGQVQICVTVFDPDPGDNLLVTFSVSAGTISAPSQSGSVRCATFTAPAGEQTVTFTATVTDGTASATTSGQIPIKKDDFGG